MIEKFIRTGILLMVSFGWAMTSFAREATPETVERPNRGTIIPSIVHLDTHDQQKFRVVMGPARHDYAYVPEDIAWSVNGIAGGNEQVGTITPGGLYKAPEKVSEFHQIHVTGTVKEADNEIITATVLLNGIPPEYRTIHTFEVDLDDPDAIAIDKNGNYLIADETIARFSPKGKYIGSFGEAGLPDGKVLETNLRIDQMVFPNNVAVDHTGKIFVSDAKNVLPRIMAFTPDGEHLYSFSEKGYHPGMTYLTRGIDFDSNNRMYIGDAWLARVTIFDNSGEYLFHFGEEGAQTGQFNAYQNLALDINDDVFIANHFGPCQKFDSKGRYLFSFAHPDPPDGNIHATDIATDRWGNAFVIVHGTKKRDAGYHTAIAPDGNRADIFKYNNHGDFITSIRLSNENRQPVRLTVDNEDRLIVLFEHDGMFGVEIFSENR